MPQITKSKCCFQGYWGRSKIPAHAMMHKAGIQRAGGTGIEPATCGFGACCPPFSNVQGRTRAGLKSPFLTAESTWTFTNVHRRWGQDWGQSNQAFQFRLDATEGRRSDSVISRRIRRSPDRTPCELCLFFILLAHLNNENRMKPLYGYSRYSLTAFTFSMLTPAV